MSESPDPTDEPRRPRPGSGRVVPAWIIIPVAGGAGLLTADWPGLVFGLLLGVFLWRLRS